MKICKNCNTENPDDATFCRKCGKDIFSKNNSNSGYIFFIILFIITTIVCFALYLSKNNDYDSQSYSLNRTISFLKSDLASAKSDLASAKSELAQNTSDLASAKSDLASAKSELAQNTSALNLLKEKVENVYPIIVNSMEIARQNFNSEIYTSGTSFYANSTHWVRTTIYFYGIKNGSIVLKTKLFMPSGELYQINESPYGCTQEKSVYISSGESDSYTSWGFSQVTWTTGRWRFEIWYGNTILSSKSFTINK